VRQQVHFNEERFRETKTHIHFREAVEVPDCREAKMGIEVDTRRLCKEVHMDKPECLIDIDLANAVNHFLMGVRTADGRSLHASLHGSLFRCPKCRKPAEAVKSKRPRRPYFRHVVEDKNCAGPPSWQRPEKAAKGEAKPQGAAAENLSCESAPGESYET
jgi:hypothetical protein